MPEPVPTDADVARPQVAVIGSGVAGLTAAHIISASARVTVFEADARLGGHADTHRVTDGSGRTLGIDTGFIVHNRHTYPTLIRLFDELGVATQDSEMSMSIADTDATGQPREWAGALGWRGIFPTWSQAFSPAHWAMLVQIPRFHRDARRLLDQTEADDLTTLAQFVAIRGYSETFVRHYLEPLVAAVWSTDPARALEFPARYLFQFLDHHGMLRIFGSPTWRTVTGGSGEYVAAIAAGIDEIRLDSPIRSVREAADGVWIDDPESGERRFDAVVIATHPHQALAMLKEPTEAHGDILGAITYSHNPAILHTDTSVMPRSRRAWASWNFRRRSDAAGGVLVSYDLTRLQRLPTTTHYLVTLGGEDLVDPATVMDRMDYEHPLYTPESVAAQRLLPTLNTDRVAFAGAYHGWGFHEDGARSGLAAATHLGFSRGMAPRAVPSLGTPQIYASTITHVRHTPFKRRFTHRSSHWLVDLDHLPPTRGFKAWATGSIQARDHLGDPAASLRDNLTGFLATRGIDLADHRVLLATHPRAFGFCFNPISVWWVLDRADAHLIATVVEVHNTYGDRHAYLLRGATTGTVDKQMYVSPFHGVDGDYRVSAPVPGGRLDIGVSLRTQPGARFDASLSGELIDAPGLGSQIGAGLVGIRDALLIRLHGIWLWGARRLPIQPRPDHHQEGVQ